MTKFFDNRHKRIVFMSRKIKIAALQLSGPVNIAPETADEDKTKIVDRLLTLLKEAVAADA